MARRALLVAPAVVALVAAGWACRQFATPTERLPAVSVVRDAVAAPPRARLAYGGVIYGPTDPSPALAGAMADVARHLGDLAGRPVAMHAGSSGQGIVLVRANGLIEPGEAERLQGKGPEAFLIRSSDDQLLRIVANGDAGLAYGLFHYLRELGFRWFFPGDHWAVVPSIASTRVREDRVVAPGFRRRAFFGTGGFGPPTPVDERRSAESRWDAWRMRNGFGGEFTLSGHAGEGFAIAHRTELEAHPEYLALVSGKRMAWSRGARYCVSNPGLQRLWVEDRVAALERELAKDPSAPHAFAVTVEPADGEGRCECDRCRRIGKGTESDQTFFLASLVGRALRERKHPERYASLMAYGQHAAPPSIPVDPNVYVTVAPEAFQRTGLSPDALIAEWKKRVPRLSLYTYWSIPDWAFDLPTLDYRHTPAERIGAWHRAGIEGIALETSYGGGATGLALYLAGQLMWNPEVDTAALLDEFYRLSFHGAFAPMKRLLERWAAQFAPTEYELGASYRDLAEARVRTAGDAAARARVRDYEVYLHYLRLWTEYRQAPKDSARVRNLVAWLYRAHDSGMMGTHRMRTLVLERLSPDPAVAADFAPGNPAAAGWAGARAPLGDGEVAAFMAEGARRYPAPAVDAKVYSSKLVQVRMPLPEEPDESLPLHLVHPTDFEIQVAPGRHLEVEITISKHRLIPFEGVTIRAEDGTTVYQERLPADGMPRPIKLQVPPGRYTCRVEDQKATFTIRAPKGVPLTTRTLTSTSLSPRVYFWVPAGLRKLAMYVPSVNPIELFDADGRKVAAAGSGIVTADVPAGQDGRAWSFRHYKSWETIRMINLPQAFARSPAALLVPEDVAAARGGE